VAFGFCELTTGDCLGAAATGMFGRISMALI
jgi:hypothetical protein